VVGNTGGYPVGVAKTAPRLIKKAANAAPQINEVAKPVPRLINEAAKPVPRLIKKAEGMLPLENIIGTRNLKRRGIALA